MLGCAIVSYTMPWRSSFPCHMTCCGLDTFKGIVQSEERSPATLM